MNILELANYNLKEQAQFKDTLNPAIWNKHEHLKNAVKDQILVGAEEYCSYLGLTESQVKDIVVAGDNAGYNYTSNSDIDVVIVADLNPDPTFREFFNENKYRYNGQQQVKVGDHLIKFYVQPADEQFVSRGSYSVIRESWTQVALRRLTEAKDTVKMLKQADTAAQPKAVKKVVKKKVIKEHKPTVYGFGREEIMEVELTPDGTNPTTSQFTNEEAPLSTEDTLVDFVHFCSDELGLENEPVLKIRKDPEWSKRNKTFGRFNGATGQLEVSVAKRHIMDVLRTIAHELTHQHQHEREDVPEDAGDTGSEWENEANARAGVLMRDYGQSNPHLFADEEQIDEAKKLTPGEKVTNWRQTEISGKEFGMQGYRVKFTDSGLFIFKGSELILKKDGDYSNPTNADLAKAKSYISNLAGGWMPDAVSESSGYIPTKKQAHDPRFEMALTVDIRPGAIGKNANKLMLNTDSQGHPQEANPNGTVKRLKEELEFIKLTEAAEADIDNLTVDQMLDYASRMHKAGFQNGVMIKKHPRWKLTTLPIGVLQLKDPGRKDIDNDHVATITELDLETKPIIVGSRGVIIDGNHRARRAFELGIDSLPAFVPKL